MKIKNIQKRMRKKCYRVSCFRHTLYSMTTVNSTSHPHRCCRRLWCAIFWRQSAVTKLINYAHNELRVCLDDNVCISFYCFHRHGVVGWFPLHKEPKPFSFHTPPFYITICEMFRTVTRSVMYIIRARTREMKNSFRHIHEGYFL